MGWVGSVFIRSSESSQMILIHVKSWTVGLVLKKKLIPWFCSISFMYVCMSNLNGQIVNGCF